MSQQDPRPPVLLLHGLARSRRSLASLARHLERAGHPTWSCTYPSRRLPIAELAAWVAERARAAAPAEAYLGVTHSLGGILVRHMAGLLRWRRVVMLAPPNDGSRVARALAGHPLYRWFYGPAGQEVAAPDGWPAPPCPFAVVAGTRDVSLANPASWMTHRLGLLPPGTPSDGTVAVDETRHPDMAAFATVEASHTWIMNHPRARALVLEFLAHGRFGDRVSPEKSGP